MKICASSSEVCTHWPLPVCARCISASKMACDRKMPEVRSAIGMPDAHRPLSRQAGDRHQPAHALGDLVHARPRRVRPALPEPRDAAIDDARIDRRDRVVIDLQPVLHVGTVVLHDHIGLLRQSHEDRVRLRRSSGSASCRACCGAGSGSRSHGGCRRPRRLSPRPGGSILITSAPQSASCRTAVGPARWAVRSRTERPCKGRLGIAELLMGDGGDAPLCEQRYWAASTRDQ